MLNYTSALLPPQRSFCLLSCLNHSGSSPSTSSSANVGPFNQIPSFHDQRRSCSLRQLVLGDPQHATGSWRRKPANQGYGRSECIQYPVGDPRACGFVQCDWFNISKHQYRVFWSPFNTCKPLNNVGASYGLAHGPIAG
jgi:hypothetical protein